MKDVETKTQEYIAFYVLFKAVLEYIRVSKLIYQTSV